MCKDHDGLKKKKKTELKGQMKEVERKGMTEGDKQAERGEMQSVQEVWKREGGGVCVCVGGGVKWVMHRGE